MKTEQRTLRVFGIDLIEFTNWYGGSLIAGPDWTDGNRHWYGWRGRIDDDTVFYKDPYQDDAAACSLPS